MFGHHDDSNQPAQDSTATVEPVQGPPQLTDDQAAPPEQPAPDADATPAADPAVVQPDPAAPPAADAPDAAAAPEAPDSTLDSAGAQDQEPAWQHPGAPLDSTKEPISDVISPAGGFPKRPSYQFAAGKPAADAPDADAAEDDPAIRELIDVKEHALDELAPLLDKLDLPPEEKFRAIMMILQANDDKSLVKAAYAVAHSIEDEEARARALYTIVNEVDYFTHAQDTDADAG